MGFGEFLSGASNLVFGEYKRDPETGERKLVSRGLMQVAQEYADEQNQELQRLSDWSDDRLVSAFRSSGNHKTSAAALRILKDRYGEEEAKRLIKEGA